MAAKRASGPSGKNLQFSIKLHETEKGQIDHWRAFAEKSGAKSLSDWLRSVADKASGRRKR